MKTDILKFNVKIKGLVPLLMARFPEEDWDQGQPVKPPKPPTKEEMYEKSLYKLDDGHLYQPAAHIIGAMEKAGKRVILKNRLSYNEVVKGGVFISPEKIPHLIQRPIIDWRPVVNKNTHPPSRIMTARGRLDEWELAFELACWDDRVFEVKLKEVLEIAGYYIGIGAYRPRYGRFEIVDWKKAK